MKTLILALFLTTAAFGSSNVPDPKCVTPVNSQDSGLRYYDAEHFWQDFCVNQLNTSPKGCQEYQQITPMDEQSTAVTRFQFRKAKALCKKQ